MSAIIASPRPGMPAAGPSNAWAERISAIWQKSTAAIIETGRLLIQARDNLDHGQWLKMVQAELPFNQRTAQRLMAIAQTSGPLKYDTRVAFTFLVGDPLRADEAPRNPVQGQAE
jgi:hypothetical protein